ncbi:MAG: recombination mediator RecR [Sulfurospirillaceae bacterium]|nr:recombination mediator RecR [Sulfurospirillaceae bacterium]MCK9545339.1 recombination mediator RecR [Sulfurospirillaceae bacterium]
MKYKLDSFHNLVEAFLALPTVGKKSAQRFAFHLVLKDPFSAMKLVHTLEKAVRSLQRCAECGGISEDEICDICLDKSRDTSLLCIVESPKDILILEENEAFVGRYYVLENVNEEEAMKLKNRVENSAIKEIIFALTPGLSSDGVILYIEEKLKECEVNFSKIAQGIPTGVQLENVDTLSLVKALNERKEV